MRFSVVQLQCLKQVGVKALTSPLILEHRESLHGFRDFVKATQAYLTVASTTSDPDIAISGYYRRAEVLLLQQRRFTSVALRELKSLFPQVFSDLAPFAGFEASLRDYLADEIAPTYLINKLSKLPTCRDIRTCVDLDLRHHVPYIMERAAFYCLDRILSETSEKQRRACGQDIFEILEKQAPSVKGFRAFHLGQELGLC